jgi:hypothetical protein
MLMASSNLSTSSLIRPVRSNRLRLLSDLDRFVYVEDVSLCRFHFCPGEDDRGCWLIPSSLNMPLIPDWLSLNDLPEMSVVPQIPYCCRCAPLLGLAWPDTVWRGTCRWGTSIRTSLPPRLSSPRSSTDTNHRPCLPFRRPFPGVLTRRHGRISTVLHVTASILPRLQPFVDPASLKTPQCGDGLVMGVRRGQ